jgi:hypothetical protein
MFAVATDPGGNRTVVLRTRPSKLGPPTLALEHAVGFKPFWKLPNLFVPAGRRLHPTLRRDAVRRLLADDPDQVVWLYPGADGKFTPEAVPDGAFRSLEDWVDYVIEAEQKPLAAWVEATRFDFDHFVCADAGGPKTRPDKPDKEPRPRDDADEARGPKGAAQPKAAAKGKPPARPANPADFLPAPEVVKPPSEWQIRRKELEQQFLAADGGLDAPERTALWPELAAASAGMGERGEAALCWLNALWDADPAPRAWLAGWVRGELKGGRDAIKADEFDRLLAAGASVEDARTAVAGFLWLAAQDPVPAWLGPRLPAVQAYLERNEGMLPVRAVWLAAYRLSQLAGADVLGLARVRDRLLQRLLDQGLTAEKDLPGFLRFAGHKDSERMRVVRDKAAELHAAVRDWTKAVPQNLPYADLLFAFAMAKLGEATPAKKLVEDARKAMEVPVPASWQDVKHFEATVSALTSNFLFKAFKYRVDQVLAGKPHTGPMAAELAAELDEVAARGKTAGTNNPYQRAEYVINRMREQSRILEPQERLDPYSNWTKNQDALKKELADLHAIKEPGKLADRIRRLHKDGVAGKPTKEVQFLVLHEALPLAGRVGEAFTAELLQLVPAGLAGAATPGTPEPPDTAKKQGELLERALLMAGHFDRGDLVKKLVDEFSDLTHGKKEDERFKLINLAAGQCLRSLKRVGGRDEIDRFLTRLNAEVLRGASTPELRKKYAPKPELWAAVLQTQLTLAGGWMGSGLPEKAAPILDEARNELLNPQAAKLPAREYTQLAQAYVTALGQGQADTGLPRITELFRKMDDKRITNTWTTAQYYSRFHLNLIESVILAVVSDEFALGPSGRKWLDDDEYLVRRRIHADMRRHLEKSGL